nr:MAG TPA: hypothetical protein [Caudoviricetes sp.]
MILSISTDIFHTLSFNIFEGISIYTQVYYDVFKGFIILKK